MQKTYTVDFLSKKRVENTGQVPQYYVEDSHPAIIDKETSHIKNLRKKLGDSSGEPHYIKTVYGVGYKLVGDDHA